MTEHRIDWDEAPGPEPTRVEILERQLEAVTERLRHAEDRARLQHTLAREWKDRAGFAGNGPSGPPYREALAELERHRAALDLAILRLQRFGHVSSAREVEAIARGRGA